MDTQKVEKKESSKGKIRALFSWLVKKWDGFWRFKDFNINRSYGGLLEKWLNADGHAPLAVALMLLVLGVLVYGPTAGWRGLEAVWLALGFSALLLFGVWYLSNAPLRDWWVPFKSRNPVLWFQVFLIVLLGAAVVAISGLAGAQNSEKLYTHIMIPVIVVLVVLPIILASVLARLLFSSLQEKTLETASGGKVKNKDWLKALLKDVELFRTPVYPEVTPGKILRSFINAFLKYPLHVLYLPAVVVLALPNAFRESLPIWFGLSLVVSAVFLTVFGLNRRLEALIHVLRRMFFHGGQLLVSIIVLFLGFGRLFEVGYISTVIEGSPTTLWFYIFSAYFAFWYFEYWINRILCEEIIGFLRSAGDPVGQASYPVNKSAATTRVDAENRVIQIHGGARLMAIGTFGSDERDAFQQYNRIDLLERLVEKSEPRSHLPKKNDMRAWITDLRNRQRFYFSVLNLALILLFWVSTTQLSKLNQVPAHTASHSDASLINLSNLIFEPKDGRQRNPVVLVAASGGGTRAALYTASVLHGLAHEGMLENVVLASGVSGGGASLAYFAAHQEELVTAASETAVWKQFYEDMSEPFIKEVLENAAEVRLLGGTRLGKLLDESFERHFGAPRMGNVRDLGVIFNTALAGRLHRAAGVGNPEDSFTQWANAHRELTKSDLAGNRLIFTNLDTNTAFPPQTIEHYKLRYVIMRDDSVRLSTAAALNANFPPVFSNSFVDVVDEQGNFGDRYWVTDGGATDNRGIISLLLALQSALNQQSETVAYKPDIHIIVAEASGMSIDYKQGDRGLATKFGAAEKFASRLMQELRMNIEERYAEIAGPGEIHLHYLEMPTALRARGGLSTHWMLPELVRISNPNESDPAKAKEESLVISSYAVKEIISRLHQPHDFYEDTPGMLRNWFDEDAVLETVNGWIRTEHDTLWNNVVKELRKSSAALTSK